MATGNELITLTVHQTQRFHRPRSKHRYPGVTPMACRPPSSRFVAVLLASFLLLLLAAVPSAHASALHSGGNGQPSLLTVMDSGGELYPVNPAGPLASGGAPIILPESEPN